MGHRQDMTDEKRLEWDINSYKAKLEANRGHNYQYYTDELEDSLFKKGYEWYSFHTTLEHTNIEDEAKDVVKELRETGYYARIICGKMQVIQKIKYYSVIYKKKP